jgi:hypothetical protein
MWLAYQMSGKLPVRISVHHEYRVKANRHFLTNEGHVTQQLLNRATPHVRGARALAFRERTGTHQRQLETFTL